MTGGDLMEFYIYYRKSWRGQKNMSGLYIQCLKTQQEKIWMSDQFGVESVENVKVQ